MKYFKKMYSLGIAVLISTAVFTGGCSGNSENAGSANGQNIGGKDIDGKGIVIVADIYPVYDWVKVIAGTDTGADVRLLLDKGVDLHSYQPNAGGIVAVNNSDIFVYIGGESEGWSEDLQTEGTALRLMDVLGDKNRLIKDEDGYDEHIWLSPSNAEICCEVIAVALAEADPDNKDKYEKNLNNYLDELGELKSEYKEFADENGERTIVVGDRFPFAYLAKDLDLDYYAAFEGCSSESEASFEKIRMLAEKADELGVNCIYALEGSDGKIAKTIADTARTQLEVKKLDSMQSLTLADEKTGKHYVEIMRKNLSVLTE